MKIITQVELMDTRPPIYSGDQVRAIFNDEPVEGDFMLHPTVTIDKKPAWFKITTVEEVRDVRGRYKPVLPAMNAVNYYVVVGVAVALKEEAETCWEMLAQSRLLTEQEVA